MQPTDDHAERALRGAVIYRKVSLGSQSEHGEQRIARPLSPHTTCRLQLIGPRDPPELRALYVRLTAIEFD